MTALDQLATTSAGKERPIRLSDFDAIRIAVASPDKILQWSHGEVFKPETINYRTQKPERDGLFDERIFGPTKDWECYCGKFKKIRYKGVVCDKCGVEVTRSSVRRERMGHIDLASPVAHIWYVRGVPSVLGTVLDLSVSDLEKVIYFAGFVVLDIDERIRTETLQQLEEEYAELGQTKLTSEERAGLDASYRSTKQEIGALKPNLILTEARYHELSLKYGSIVRVGIGAEALYDLLKRLDVPATIEQLKATANEAVGATRRKLLKRLRLLTDMTEAGIDPLWLVLTRIPVLPPDLRPMVQLDGGRFASSDLNDLYRRVLNRNNRLKKLLSKGAPEVICRNERRMLQEAVDALIDNSARRGRAVSTGATQRRLKSLSDMLRGKQGRFRQNLLGKRVDYSGRSVIVVGPKLKLHQCGLPKVMALELFKPFVISKLISEGHIHNVKNATRLIERGSPEVWDILERVTKEKYVLLNRAPTLHRLGIQAFQPVLIEGKAIQIHPLVCQAYNADFDGDQMAVHVPLSEPAAWEASEIMRSTRNLLKPASGEPIVSPRLDIVFGMYYLTSLEEDVRGKGSIFASKTEAILAYDQRVVHVRAPIRVRLKLAPTAEPTLVETSVGRILFNNILPDELQFVNAVMDAKALKRIVAACFDRYGSDETAQLVDRIKNLGFEHARLSGMTISLSDIEIPAEKDALMSASEQELAVVEKQFARGLITDAERSIKTIELWLKTREQLEQLLIGSLTTKNPLHIAVKSGARGTPAQLVQMAGMKGLMVSPTGAIIEVPVKSNFKEGLDELEYFNSTHGARKGKSDTALRTSDAGYLTRRLVDVAQDIVVAEAKCQTMVGITIDRSESSDVGQEFSERLVGRTAVEAIKLPATRKPLVNTGAEIDEQAAALIQASAVERIVVRSPIYCTATRGICQACYGRDLATGRLVELGTVIGIMAAQAIGEPGTQLTLKTFHMGGVSGTTDITTGLPRVEELFEARIPKTPAVMSELAGRVRTHTGKEGRTVTVTSDEMPSERLSLPKGYEPIVKNGTVVRAKELVASATGKPGIKAPIGGKVTIHNDTVSIRAIELISREYAIPEGAAIRVKNGDVVSAGDELTEGHLDLGLALKLKGRAAIERYIIRGIQEIYSAQGQSINDKHVEIILRRMLSKVYITEGGTSEYVAGQIANRTDVLAENERRAAKKQPPIESDEIILGVTRVALKTESFLSAASFQETTGVLIDSAIRGAVDRLKGLKENVIIGKLIPAGTGFGVDQSAER
jgi:DNA-directed RNA polymerase subunit beta'